MRAAKEGRRMEEGSGERESDEDLTDWTPGGNLKKALISENKGKREVTQRGGKGQEGSLWAALAADPRGRGDRGAGCSRARGSAPGATGAGGWGE